jgi:hypothetical protein
MRTRLLGSIAIATLALAACGGGGGGDQDEVADMIIDAAADEDFQLDEGCVRDVASKLSDDDAAKMLEAGPDGNPDLSEDADALASDMFSCVDTDQMVDQLVEQMGDEGFDADCLKEVLADFDPEALANGEMPDGMFDCVDLGG